MKTKTAALIMSISFALILCGAVSAEDVGNNSTGLADTAWPSFQGDSNHTGQSDYNGPQTNTTEWILPGSSNQNSNLAIGKDGTIYCGFRGNNYLYALYSNGTEKWKFSTSKAIVSVAISKNGTIYASDENNAIHAFKDNGNNATIIWSYTAKYLKMISIGPDGTLYFGSGNGAKSTPYTFNALKDNGNGTCTLKWTFPTSGMLYSPPTISKDGTIYFGTYGYLYALRDNGNNCTLKWKFEHRNLIRCNPSIGPDGTLYFGVQGESGGEPYTFYALIDNGDSFKIKWADNIGNINAYSLAIANDGTIYVGTTNSGIMAFKDNGDDNFKLWNYTFINSDLLSSPVIGADGTIYIGSGDAGDIYAFYHNGTVKWKYVLGTKIFNLAIDSNGALYVHTEYSLFAFKDPAPVADFSANTTNGTTSQAIQFTDKSNYPTSWFWDFGDGTTSTLKNPSHTYTKSGTYTVKLTVTNNNGNDRDEKTITNYITVIDTTAPVPKADLPGGSYNTTQIVNLTATDNQDVNPKIYYTLDDSTPTTSSKLYDGPITIANTATLKFITVDEAGNQSPVYFETYNIKSDVYVNIIPSKTNPQIGDKVTYTFKLGNNGPGIAKDVVFTYVIPGGVEFAGAKVDQGTWTYDEATRTLTWKLGDVAVGDPYLWLDLNILSAGSFNIKPIVSVAGYNPELASNIGSLLVNAVSVPTSTVTVNAASQTIPMQDTGVHLTCLTIALLMVGSGLALARKK